MSRRFKKPLEKKSVREAERSTKKRGAKHPFAAKASDKRGPGQRSFDKPFDEDRSSPPPPA